MSAPTHAKLTIYNNGDVELFSKNNGSQTINSVSLNKKAFFRGVQVNNFSGTEWQVSMQFASSAALMVLSEEAEVWVQNSSNELAQVFPTDTATNWLADDADKAFYCQRKIHELIHA
jgi:hypothetical protein